MKSFIERVFMAKKLKEESVQDLATEAVVESIEVKQPKETKHDINSCSCYKCEIARDQGAK